MLEPRERLVLELMLALLAELAKVAVLDPLEMSVVLELVLALLVEPGEVVVPELLEIDVVVELVLRLLTDTRGVAMVDALEADAVLLPVFAGSLLVELIEETLLEEIEKVKVSTVPFARVVIEVPTSLAAVKLMQPAVVQRLWLAKVEETPVTLLLTLDAVELDPDAEVEETIDSEDVNETVE